MPTLYQDELGHWIAFSSEIWGAVYTLGDTQAEARKEWEAERAKQEQTQAKRCREGAHRADSGPAVRRVRN